MKKETKKIVENAYNNISKYGNNYIRYDSADRQKVKTTTLLFGAAFTEVGIYLQNKKRRNGKKG